MTLQAELEALLEAIASEPVPPRIAALAAELQKALDLSREFSTEDSRESTD